MPLPAATLTAVVEGQHVNEDQTGSLSGERPAPGGSPLEADPGAGVNYPALKLR